MDNTKSYKHKPTGRIYELLNNTTYGFYQGEMYLTVTREVVESGNDWEEVEHGDYEILSVTTSGNIYKVINNELQCLAGGTVIARDRKCKSSNIHDILKTENWWSIEFE